MASHREDSRHLNRKMRPRAHSHRLECWLSRMPVLPLGRGRRRWRRSGRRCRCAIDRLPIEIDQCHPSAGFNDHLLVTGIGKMHHQAVACLETGTINLSGNCARSIGVICSPARSNACPKTFRASPPSGLIWHVMQPSWAGLRNGSLR